MMGMVMVVARLKVMVRVGRVYTLLVPLVPNRLSSVLPSTPSALPDGNVQFELYIVATLDSIPPLHYGLTGGLVQNFKASYLGYLLQCALTDYARGKHDGHTIPWP